MDRFWCALVAILLAAPSAFGQAAPPADPPVVADQSPALFVVNARQATLQGDKLMLDGVSPGAVVFATRPSRSILHVATLDLIELWRTGSFARSPPNAVVSVFAKDGSGISDVVVVLARPALSAEKLVFDVAVVNGSIAGAEGPASVFIDTVWFQGGQYIGTSRTTGGTSPAVGSKSDTSTLRGWSNPAPSAEPPARQPQCGRPPLPPCR